jgi:hypothetical protein
VCSYTFSGSNSKPIFWPWTLHLYRFTNLPDGMKVRCRLWQKLPVWVHDFDFGLTVLWNGTLNEKLLRQHSAWHFVPTNVRLWLRVICHVSMPFRTASRLQSQHSSSQHNWGECMWTQEGQVKHKSHLHDRQCHDSFIAVGSDKVLGAWPASCRVSPAYIVCVACSQGSCHDPFFLKFHSTLGFNPLPAKKSAKRQGREQRDPHLTPKPKEMAARIVLLPLPFSPPIKLICTSDIQSWTS